MLIALIAAVATQPPSPPGRATNVPAVIDRTASGVTTYTVRTGDTLSGLALRYMNAMSDYRVVQRLNAIADPYHLQPGSTLRIPRNLLKGVLLDARIVAFQGAVTIDGKKPAGLKTQVREGARIATAGAASVTFQLIDGSRISLPSLSTIRIVRLRRVTLTGEVERDFMLETGRSDVKVTPSRQGRDKFEIRTPVSVAAVRGTEFKVAVIDDGMAATTSVTKGDVGVGAAGEQTDVPASYGVHSDANGPGKAVALLPPPDFQPPVHIEEDGTQVFTVEASSAAGRYRLQIANDEDFKDIRSEYTESKPTFRVPPLPPGTYSVRASAIDKNDIEGIPTDIYTYAYKGYVNPRANRGKGTAPATP